MLGIEQPLPVQLFLQLLKGHGKIACSLRGQGFAV